MSRSNIRDTGINRNQVVRFDNKNLLVARHSKTSSKNSLCLVFRVKSFGFILICWLILNIYFLKVIKPFKFVLRPSGSLSLLAKLLYNCLLSWAHSFLPTLAPLSPQAETVLVFAFSSVFHVFQDSHSNYFLSTCIISYLY